MCFEVGRGVRRGSVVGGGVPLCGVCLRVGKAMWVAVGGVGYCGLVWMLRGVGGGRVCWYILGNGVGGRGVKEGAERVEGRG